MFLAEQELRQLLSWIVTHFPTGQIALNAATTRSGPTSRTTHGRISCSPTVKRAEERMIIESPWLSHASKAYRTTCAVMKSIPALRAQGGRILRYMF